MKNLTRRDFMKLSGLGMMGVAITSLSACSKDGTTDKKDDKGTNTGDTSGDTSTNVPQTTDLNKGDAQGALTADEGTEFVKLDSAVIGTGSVLTSLTPFRNTNGQRALIIRYLYDRLALPNNMGEYVPQGAKSWSVADDGVTWTVELYDNITDSEGNHITADDVVWFVEQSIERATKPCFKKVSIIKAINPTTVEVVLIADIADAMNVFLESTFMLSKTAFEASPDEMTFDVVSSSPYKVTEFNAEADITFTLRDDFWQDEELLDPACGANIKQFKMLAISEASQMQIAMETGTVDAFPGINVNVVDRFVDDENYLVTFTPSNNASTLLISGSPDRLVGQDINLRKAICHAIDRQGIIDGVLKGRAELSNDIIGRTSSGWQESWLDEEYYPYDPEKAKEYLAQSSYKGEEIVLAGTAQSEQTFVLIQAYLQAVGITCKLDMMANALWQTMNLDGRQWDMSLMSTGNGGANVWSQMADPDAYDYGNVVAVKDDELRELVHNAWKNANYTPENINAVHRYFTDNAYFFGLYLSYANSVARTDLGIVETQFNNQGMLDLPACKFAEV